MKTMANQHAMNRIGISSVHFFLLIILTLGASLSCSKNQELENRIDNLEQIVSISLSKQIESMQQSLNNLERSSSQLGDLVSTLNGDVSGLKTKSEGFKSDIANLRTMIDSQSSDLQSWASGLFATLSQYQLVSDDITAIKQALSTTEVLAGKVSKLMDGLDACEKEIDSIKESLQKVLGDIDSIKKKIAQIIGSIQSVVVVPDFSDGSVLMTGSESNEIKFEIYPLSAADSIAKIGVTALSLDYVMTSTKSSDQMENIPLTKASFNGKTLSVIADGSALSPNILSGAQPINARLRVSDGVMTRSSDFFSLFLSPNACLTLGSELTSPTTVKLSGYAESLSGTGNNVEAGFELSNESGMTDAQKIPATIQPGIKSFSLLVPALQPETTYFYRAYCQADGRVHYGEIKSFETTNYEMVDLGLSVKWATCNIGAGSPSEVGGFFAWGELEEKEDYREDNYDVPFQEMLSESYDVATQRMGGQWRMPTQTEFLELIEKCEFIWESDYNGTGVSGIRVRSGKSSDGNESSIFFPTTGPDKGLPTLTDGHYYDPYHCAYWSSSNGFPGYSLSFYGNRIDSWDEGWDTQKGTSLSSSFYGKAIRPVWGKRKNDVSDLKLSDLTIPLGVEVRAECIVMPENVHSKYVRWTIADSKVAEIKTFSDNICVIVGKQLGTTKLIASSSSGIRKECTLTVQEKVYSEPELVDLGLSVKWAAWNLGASSAEERGDLCLWGDDQIGDYSGREYKWWSPGNYRTFYEDFMSLQGYNLFESLGVVDNRGVLSPEDDIVSIKLGDKWRIPTLKEWEELNNNCVIWPVKNYKNTGVAGHLFESKVPGYEGNSVFLPSYSSAYYWSATVAPSIYESYIFWAESLNFPKIERGSLCAIRPVYGERRPRLSGIKPTHSEIQVREWSEIPVSILFTPENPQSEEIIWSFGDDDVAFLDKRGGTVNPNNLRSASVGQTTITATSVDGGYRTAFNVTVTPAEYNKDYVDLGIGVKWATCNLGALSPEETGMIYRWGETVPINPNKSDHSTYRWINPDTNPTTLTKYTQRNEILDPDDDVAHVRLGGKWRMPTFQEVSALANRCTWTLVKNYEDTGVDGVLVTGKNGNSIFFPFGGYYSGRFNGKNSGMAIWSSTFYENSFAKALRCTSSSQVPQAATESVMYCFAIRPVYADE